MRFLVFQYFCCGEPEASVTFLTEVMFSERVHLSLFFILNLLSFFLLSRLKVPTLALALVLEPFLDGYNEIGLTARTDPVSLHMAGVLSP